MCKERERSEARADVHGVDIHSLYFGDHYLTRMNIMREFTCSSYLQRRSRTASCQNWNLIGMEKMNLNFCLLSRF